MANVVALLIDATVGLTKQDLVIAQGVVDEGRALVIVLNKIDECKVCSFLTPAQFVWPVLSHLGLLAVYCCLWWFFRQGATLIALPTRRSVA